MRLLENFRDWVHTEKLRVRAKVYPNMLGHMKKAQCEYENALRLDR
jgi:hypothetical protein